MLIRNDDVIHPLVADIEFTQSLMQSLTSPSEFPYLEKLNEYFLTWETTRNEDGDFVKALELKELLVPYANLINRPDICRWRIFYSFFISISHEKTDEENQLCLAQVIVLLQFLANPDLTMNENKVSRSSSILLNNIFKNTEFELDVLNLLFSYGLSYERFLEELLFVMQSIDQIRHLSTLKTVQSLETFISTASIEEKNTLSRLSGIYRPIFDVQRNNIQISAYLLLRNAYRAYREHDYVRASNFYTLASNTLTALSTKPELNSLIQKDYNSRSHRCEEYVKKCSNLRESQKNSYSSFNFTFFQLIGCGGQNQQTLLENSMKKTV